MGASSSRFASCLGTKRGLCGSDSKLVPRPCCYNERDAARVCADLKLLMFVACDLQKSVFDAGWLRFGASEDDGVRLGTVCMVYGGG